MAQPYQLVVDLGTCHTVAVVRRAGEAARPLLFDGSPLLPSGVYRDVTGRLSVGRDAERLAATTPDRYEPFPKRCVDDGSVLLGDAPTPVVELLAALLRRVAGEAGAQGNRPESVTLTCPADWGAPRREVLRAAARTAGLGQVALVDEPVAAAMYCAEVLGQQIPLGHCLLIFDFGGGTLDVTVIRREPPGLRTLAVGGLDNLGGVDVDAALVGHLGQLVALRAPRVWERLTRPQGTGDLRDRRAFWDQVRGAKEMLSRTAAAPVPLPGSDDAVHLTREELERVAGPLIDRAVDETRRVLERAAVPHGLLAGILLVGGSSRIPLVAHRLHTRFGVAPTVPEQPELPVALGALLVGPPPGPGPGTPPGLPRHGAPQPGPPMSGRPPVSGGPPAGSPISGGPISGGPISVGPVSGSPISGMPVSGEPTGSGGMPVSGVPAGLSASTGIPIQPGPPGQPSRYPAALPWGPGGAPPRPRQQPEHGTRRAVLIGVLVLVLVAGLGFGGYRVIEALGHAANSAIGGGGSGSSAGGGSGGALTAFGGSPISLGGTGQAGVTFGTDAVYYAVPATNHTDVYAVPLPGTKGPTWHKSVPVAPATATLTVVSDLLVIDAEKSTVDGGKDTRAVVQRGDGKFLWKGNWEQHKTVAYFGTDAIVATDFPLTTQRISMKNGHPVWKHNPPGNVVTAYHMVKPMLTWAASGGGTEVADDNGLFHESLGVDTSKVIDLYGDDDKAEVLNASNGRAITGGAVPIDDDLIDTTWVAFDGLYLGAAADGAPSLLAYSAGNLAKKWSYALPAGADVKRVKPCAVHLVCVVTDADDRQVLAVNTTDGKAAWTAPVTVDTSDDAGWYVLGGAVLVGDQPFDVLSPMRSYPVSLLDTGKGAVKDLGVGKSAEAAAGSGHFAGLLESTLVGDNPHWTASVLDLTTKRRSTTLDVGGTKKVPVFASGGRSLAVINENKLYLGQAAGLPAS